MYTIISVTLSHCHIENRLVQVFVHSKKHIICLWSFVRLADRFCGLVWKSCKQAKRHGKTQHLKDTRRTLTAAQNNWNWEVYRPRTTDKFLRCFLNDPHLFVMVSLLPQHKRKTSMPSETFRETLVTTTPILSQTLEQHLTHRM